MTQQTVTRRHFLKTAGASALVFPTIVPATAIAKPGRTLPNSRVNLGFIGVGNMGTGHLRSFLGYDDVHVISACDVRKEHRDRAKTMVDEKYGDSQCRTYNNHVELLRDPDLDAVLIASPDHWHVLQGIDTARHGKAMYYEKPASYTVEEAQMLRREINRYNPIFQFGTQQRSNSRFRHALELIRNGRIGQLEHITLGSASFQAVPDQPEEPVPDGLDYERWLGPAPYKPYNTLRCTRNWTVIRDYSLGCISGAWGIHHVDIAQWTNDADDTGPISVEGTGSIPDGLYDTYQRFEVEHRYANGVKLTHIDHITAMQKHPFYQELDGGNSMGILFEGDEGWIYVARNYIDSNPKSLLREVIGPNEFKLPVSNDHRRNFIESVKKGTHPICPVGPGVKSEIVCQQAEIAMRLGRKLRWDNSTETFIDDPEANALLSSPMREPWKLPA